MTPNLNASVAPRPTSETDFQRTIAVPSWWLAEQERFDALVETRLKIHLHEKGAARKAASAIAVGISIAVSIYSVDAIGAVSMPAASGLLVFFVAIAIPMAVAWLLERRLVQQLSDINLRSQLWLDLVDAVTHGHVDLARLESAHSDETEIETFLRKEIAIAARFVASRRTLAPHLPIFGHCFTLENS